MAQKPNKKAAAVQCAGGCRAKEKISREGFSGDCRQALEAHPEGILACQWGCLGLGSCVSVCPVHAITIGENGTPVVDRAACTGCGRCAEACPKGLICLTSPELTIHAACANQDKGAETREVCSVGCIACGICVKNCPAGAIHLENNHAVIDEAKCIACGMCAVKCPRGIILDADGIFTVKG